MSSMSLGRQHSGAGGLQRPYTVGTFQKRLNDFQELVKELTLQDVEATPEERRQLITENLRYDQFCEAIRALFGADIKNHDLKAIYRKISTNPDADVDWSELFGYFQSENEEQEISVGEEVNVFTVSKKARVGDAAGDRKRRDIIQCIKYIRALDLYITGSQKGTLSLWTMKLRLQGCTDINESAWVTGCDYLPSLRRVACSTERSLVIWDCRAKGKNQSIFVVKPIEHSPQCMTYVPYAKNQMNEDTIIFGDDQGNINLLTICGKDLTMKNSKIDKKNVQNFIIDPSNLSYPIYKRKAHDDWVVQVKYFPELKCFGSCSPSSNNSFVLEEVDRIVKHNEELRGVCIPKGVNAFDYCARANVLATGGVDKVIRIWHPHIFSRPTGKLIGHLFTIVEIACNEKDQHIISLSTARVFRVWDIHTLTSLQVFTDNEERPGEKRIYSMLFDDKHDRLMTGSSVFDAWPLTRAVQDTMQVPHTHDRPINHILFNSELNQIISVCAESIIKVWEVETGKLVYQVPNPHGANIEVTSLALDKTGYRLVTGATDGSLKIWDFGSGQEIKYKPGKGHPDEDLSITGLLYFKNDEERCILATGWSNKMRLFVDPENNHDLPLLTEFSDIYYYSQAEEAVSPRDTPISPRTGDTTFNKSTPLPDIGSTEPTYASSAYRKDHLLTSHEMLCMTSQLPKRVLTGCSNGNTLLWNLEKSGVENLFILPESSNASSATSLSRSRPARRRSAPDKRCNCLAVLVHKNRRLDPAFIKSLTKHFDDDNDEDELTERPARESAMSHSRRPTIVSEEVSQGDIKQVTGDRAPDDPSQSDVVKKEKGSTEENSKEKADDVKVNAVHVTIDEENADNVDPEDHMIVDTFDPVLVTGHQDSYIRFWTMDNERRLFRQTISVTRRQGSAITALSYDEDCNILIVGDQKGYIILWDIGKFLENPAPSGEEDNSDGEDSLQQVVSWRAHLTKVVSLQYIESLKAIISGSTDGSVRVWWGRGGRFVGFYGQPRPFNFPQSEETSSTPTLPYDITENPLAHITKAKGDKDKPGSNQKFEYPLIFDNERWKPFRRSAYNTKRQERQEPTDKKFFEALVKPKTSSVHEVIETPATPAQVFTVYRSLPVYTVHTPEEPKAPEVSYPTIDDDSSYLYTGGQPAKTESKPSKAGKSNKKDGGEKTSKSPTRRR